MGLPGTARLGLDPSKTVKFSRECFGEDREGDLSPELRVNGLAVLVHAALSAWGRLLSNGQVGS